VRRHPLILLLLCYSFFLVAQPNNDRFIQLKLDLEDYALENPKIEKLIDISITGTLKEFALAFSRETKVNLTIDPTIDKQIVTNFSDTKPKDILLHLCRFYELDLTFSGSIIGLVPFDAPKQALRSKEIQITFNSYNNKLTLDLKQDTLDLVVKKISELTEKNIITTPASSGIKVSGFVGSTDFENALEQMAKRNNLSVQQNEKGYYVIDKVQKLKSSNSPENAASTASRRQTGRGNGARGAASRPAVAGLDVTLIEGNRGAKQLKIVAENTPLAEVIKAAAEKMGSSYFLMTEAVEPVSFQMEGVDFEEFLSKALLGSPYAFKKDNNLYLIGNETEGSLKESRVIQLQHRSVNELAQYIPTDMSEGVQVMEFIQLNALILSGAPGPMQEVASFIREIDKSVPVVMIELLIIDVQDNKEFRAGVEAGITTEPVASGGAIYPSVDFTFSSNAINDLLSTLAGNGIVNLGQVKPNFYATLQAVEDNGFAKVRSKPRLSTLNGVEASLSLGETRYFLNERTTLQGNQNPISLQDRRYEAVNADFSIRIIPVVSGDEYVTLEIEVNQSDFIGQVQNNAPPPQVNRTFNSNIRILNQEMIVLGGLESKSVEESGTGVPFLSRIPVLKWLFSKRRRARSKSKLLVFVRPSVIY